MAGRNDRDTLAQLLGATGGSAFDHNAWLARGTVPMVKILRCIHGLRQCVAAIITDDSKEAQLARLEELDEHILTALAEYERWSVETDKMFGPGATS